jgi:3-oxoacyl-[acyl-carrier-protein] synthase-3
MPSGMITDVVEATLRATGAHRRRSRLVRAASGQQAHHRRVGQEARHRPEKVVTTVDRHGNTSAASVPLALSVAVADGRIKRGRPRVMIEAMGGGFTWGAVADNPLVTAIGRGAQFHP